MRFLLKVSLIIALGYLSGLVLPWWSVVVIAALVCLFLSEKEKRRYKKSYSLSFLAGFLAVFLLWGTLAFVSNQENNAILGNRIAELVFQKQNALLAVFASALVGGLVGGFGAMTGGLLGKIWKERRA